MSGNLCHQIEHHLYPGSAEQPARTRSRCGSAQVCDKYDLPYTTGSFLVQYGKSWRTIAKLSLPDKFLRDTADDAPETRSERMFAELEPGSPAPTRPPAAARAEVRDRRGAAVVAPGGAEGLGCREEARQSGGVTL